MEEISGQWKISYISLQTVMYPEFFWENQYTNQTHKGFVPPDTLEMHSLVLSVLRFLCKTFLKLLRLTLQKTLFHRWFLKNSHIQIKNLYGYKNL